MTPNITVDSNRPASRILNDGIQTQGTLTVMAEDNYKLDVAPIQPGPTKILLSDPHLPNGVPSQRTNPQKLEDTE